MSDNQSSEVVKGVIENVVFRNDENDYTVLEVADEKLGLVTCVGIIPMAFEGETVVLNGYWTFHKEFGRQFSFESYEKALSRPYGLPRHHSYDSFRLQYG